MSTIAAEPLKRISVRNPFQDVTLDGGPTLPASARVIVLVAHGSGGSLLSTRA